MDWFGYVILYALIWWVALFIVLPIGTRPVDSEADEGGWRGAPARPMILRKAIGTTALAFVLWLGCMAIIESDWIDFRDGVWAYTGPGSSTLFPSNAQN